MARKSLRKTLSAIVTVAGAMALGTALPTLAQQQAPAPSAEAKPFTTKPVVDPQGSFRFAIMSDRTGGARAGVFERAIDQVNLLKPEFVVSVGDLVEGYAENPAVLAQQWEEFETILARLDARFYRVAGNHDLSNTAMLANWRKQFGNPYYSFVYKNVLFLVLDTDDPPASTLNMLPKIFPEPGKAEEVQKLLETNPRHANELISAQIHKLKIPIEELTPASITQEQARWAEQTLAAHPEVRWTIVLLHKPAWLYQNANNAFPQIQAALAKRRYTVFAGHEHYYQRDVIDGRDYFRLGTTGGEWIRKGPGAVDHISWVTMDDNGPHVANIRVDGMFGPEGPKEPSTTETDSAPGH